MKGEVCTAVIAAGPLLKACRGMRKPRSRRFYLSLEVLIKGTDYFRLLFVCLYFIIFNEFINPEVSGKACTAMPAI